MAWLVCFYLDHFTRTIERALQKTWHVSREHVDANSAGKVASIAKPMVALQTDRAYACRSSASPLRSGQENENETYEQHGSLVATALPKDIRSLVLFRVRLKRETRDPPNQGRKSIAN